MKKPVIAVDKDDVVGGFNHAYITHHNKHYGSNLRYEDAYTFDMCELYGIDQPTLVGRVRHFCHNYHDEIKPHHGAAEALRALREISDPQLLTSRCDSLREISINWLDAHGLNHFSAHHFTNGFGTLYPDRKKTKAEVCHEIGAQILIEDAPENVLSVAASGVTVLMPNRPWNQEVSAENVLRMSSWKETLKWIKEHI